MISFGNFGDRDLYSVSYRSYYYSGEMNRFQVFLICIFEVSLYSSFFYCFAELCAYFHDSMHFEVTVRLSLLSLRRDCSLCHKLVINYFVNNS